LITAFCVHAAKSLAIVVNVGSRGAPRRQPAAPRRTV